VVHSDRRKNPLYRVALPESAIKLPSGGSLARRENAPEFEPAPRLKRCVAWIVNILVRWVIYLASADRPTNPAIVSDSRSCLNVAHMRLRVNEIRQCSFWVSADSRDLSGFFCEAGPPNRTKNIREQRVPICTKLQKMLTDFQRTPESKRRSARDHVESERGVCLKSDSGKEIPSSLQVRRSLEIAYALRLRPTAIQAPASEKRNQSLLLRNVYP